LQVITVGIAPACLVLIFGTATAALLAQVFLSKHNNRLDGRYYRSDAPSERRGHDPVGYMELLIAEGDRIGFTQDQKPDEC
jgi:hypothetical protein